MKILIVCQHYFPERFRITDIAESLVNEYKHDVTVITALPNYPEGIIFPSYKDKKRRFELINNVKVYRSNIIPRGKSFLKRVLNYFSFPFFSSKLVRRLSKESFDLVFVYQLSPILMAIPGIKYKKKKHIACLLYSLDLWPESLKAGGVSEKSYIFKIFKKISRKIYAKSDKILVTSPGFIRYFQENLNIRDVPIDYLPQYAEDLFDKGNTNIIEKAKKKHFNFLFAGNIGKLQSVETILLAANELRNYSNILFTIVGDGSELDSLRELVNKLDLRNVEMLGGKSLNEMPKYYESADAFLITLKADKVLSRTIPGKVQSYLAFGKPIIGAIDGETNKLIKENDFGYVAKAEDYFRLSENILEYVQNEDKDLLNHNAYNYYINNYSKSSFMKKLIKEMELLVNVCK